MSVDLVVFHGVDDVAENEFGYRGLGRGFLPSRPEEVPDLVEISAVPHAPPRSLSVLQ